MNDSVDTNNQKVLLRARCTESAVEWAFNKRKKGSYRPTRAAFTRAQLRTLVAEAIFQYERQRGGTVGV